jgi:molybdopterin-guanine dinucleotide biosynthesis protein A
MSKAPLYGLVLCGGQSLRMGEDKSLLIYHQRQQWEEAAHLLQALCERVYFSVSSGAGIPETMDTGQIIMDQSGAPAGPLRGIYSALTTHPRAAWLTIPIDMPLLTHERLQHLMLCRNETKPATCYRVQNRIEPLVTIWEPEAQAALTAFIQQGGFSPKQFLETHDVHVIDCSEADWTLNINTPQERARFFDNLH